MAASFNIPTILLVLMAIYGFVNLPVYGKPLVSSVSRDLSEATVVVLPAASVLVESYSREDEVLEDGYYVTGDARVKVKRQAVMNKTRTWPSGIVPYVLDKAFAPDIIATIEASMREVELNVGNSTHPCIRFIPRTTEVNYLDAHFGNGCSSVIGLDYTGPQVSTFSATCAMKGLLLHELLHTLGIYHEQDRFDRDDFIIMNKTNLLPDAERNYVVKNISDIDILGTPYDFTSVMHYGPYSFPKDPRYPVMTPKLKYSTGTFMGQRYALSRLDVLRVQRLYRCAEDTSHMQSDITEDKVLFWCDFENDTCNLTISTSQPEVPHDNVSSPEPAHNALWVTTTHAAGGGPQTGSTNGLDPFFYASREIHENTVESSVTFDQSQGSTETLMESGSQSGSPYGLSQEMSLGEIQELFLLDKSQESELPVNLTHESASTDNPTQEPQILNSTVPPPRVTVSLTTPTFNTGDMCLDLHLHQEGPSSFLELYVKGPTFHRARFHTREGFYLNHWLSIRMSLPIPKGIEFQLEFVAVLDEGSVALDDVHILTGVCQ